MIMSEVPWIIPFSHSSSMGSRLQAVVGHSRFDLDPVPRMESSVLDSQHLCIMYGYSGFNR